MKSLTYSQMAERDARARLDTDAINPNIDSPCPCGKRVVEVYVTRDMVGGRNNIRMRYYHNRVDYCESVRRF